MTTNVAHLAGRSVRYLEAGSGQPIVLLHAFPLSADQWLPQLHRVPVGRRVIAPDLRGFQGAEPALSDVALEGISIDDYATDVLELMSHLDLDRAVIGGLSMGGYVAMAIAARAPDRTAGLVLANTRAAADSPDARAARDRMIDLVRREGPAAVSRELVPKLLGQTSRREQPDLMDAVGRLIEANSADALAAAILAIRNRPDRTALLRSLTCPAVIVSGAEDALIPAAESLAMHHAIAGSRLIVLPKAGHLSNLEDPVGFGDALG